MNRRDIVLVNIPFVGAPGGKVRPALVIQNDGLNATLRETVIAEITSNLAHATRPHQVLVDIGTPAGSGTGLLANSAIRCERLHTIPQVDVRKTIGRLPQALMASVDIALRSALGII
jgi:mRNA-degrading endonuclease toxin of MazEF toxin-antitoxin module